MPKVISNTSPLLYLYRIMDRRNFTKAEMARRMKTSRASLERLLDPSHSSVTLATLERAATVLGKKLKIELA